jgi:hypothetical protein
MWYDYELIQHIREETKPIIYIRYKLNIRLYENEI